MSAAHSEADRALAAKTAYEAFAPSYDDFTAHYDYPGWLGNVLPKLEGHGLEGDRLLDVACGTGNSFLWMIEHGWKVTACDIAPSMLERARSKAGNSARLSVADMRDLPTFGQFDLVWALGDAINYMLSGEELEAALTGMRRNLAPGGLGLFDLNTLCNYRTFFAETQVVERDGRKLIWEGQAAPDAGPGQIYEARFRIEAAGDSSSASGAHRHIQRHFPEDEALAAVEAAGLVCLDVFSYGHDAVLRQPPDELAHHKAIFIVRSR